MLLLSAPRLRLLLRLRLPLPMLLQSGKGLF